MLNQIALIAFIVVGTVFAAILAWLSPVIRTWIMDKVDNTMAEGILLRLEEFVVNVVIELDQTIVDQLKKDGKWNAEEAAKVKKLAIDKIKSYFGQEGIDNFMKIFGLDNDTFEKFLSTLIESAVRENKA